MKVRRLELFLISYSLMVISLVLGYVENLPYENIVAKVKYIYIVWGIVDILKDGAIPLKKNVKKIYYILAILFAYVFLFGILIVNNIVKEEIFENFKLTVIYLILLCLTVNRLIRYQCIKSFLFSSYLCIILVLVWSFFTHLGQVSRNPLFLFKIIFSNLKANSTFGLGHWNYVGNLCFVSWVISVLLLNEEERFNKKKMFIYCCNVILFLMIISSSSRAALTSILVFYVILLICQVYYGKIRNKTRFILLLAAGICVAVVLAYGSGVFNYVWNNSNRSLNVLVNMKYFKELGNMWTGMGFVENGAFQTNSNNNYVSAFGVTTSSVDVNYVYIFYTTGIVGSAIMLMVLILILQGIIKIENFQNKALMLSLYITILYYAMWEVVLFSFRHIGMMILFVTIFYYIGEFSNYK